MSLARSLRRLLALMTLVMPIDMVSPCAGADDEAAGKAEMVETVFRHYV
ncbi:hypothetical protein [Methylobacterium nigriterrae]